MPKENHILSCDWGTSSLRLRLVDLSNNNIIAEKNSAEGIAKTFEAWKNSNGEGRVEFYLAQVKTLIGIISIEKKIDLTGIPVVISGMASSSIGMYELPYAELPFALDGANALVHNFPGTDSFPYPSMLISGVRNDRNVMRGEETQLIGMADMVNLPPGSKEAIFIFPGTHSKHVYVSNGELQNFDTYITGELFNLLGTHSILKDSIDTTALAEITQDNKEAFISGLQESVASGIMKSLFTVRTNDLFKRFDKKQNAHYLSGLLIGEELKIISAKTDATVVLCSASNLSSFYTTALETMNLPGSAIIIDPDVMDIASVLGQIKIFRYNPSFTLGATLA